MYRSIGGYVCGRECVLLTRVVQCRGSTCLFGGKMLHVHPRAFAWVAAASPRGDVPAPACASLNIPVCVWLLQHEGRVRKEGGWVQVLPVIPQRPSLVCRAAFSGQHTPCTLSREGAVLWSRGMGHMLPVHSLCSQPGRRNTTFNILSDST